MCCLFSLSLTLSLHIDVFLVQLYEGSALHSAYLQHLSSAAGLYQKLSANLEDRFGHSPPSIAVLQGSQSCDYHMMVSYV